MGYHKIWIVCMISTVFLIGYACQDQAFDPVSSEQASSDALNKLSGQAHGSGMAGQMQRNFRAHLNGEGVVPSVDTQAQGEAIFQVSKDGMEISYKLNAANIQNLFGAHIHLGRADENGPVVVPLYTGPPIDGRFQGVLAEGTITAADVSGGDLEGLLMDIQKDSAYVQVHTQQNPPGEIRGQIR